MSVMERRDYKKIYKSMTLQKFANKTEIPVSPSKPFRFIRFLIVVSSKECKAKVLKILKL